MDGSAVVNALMGLAGGGGQSPQGPGAGQPPGGGMGAPPGGGGPGGPPGQGGGQASPQDLIQHGMVALFMGLSQMGLQETANEIVDRLTKRFERLQKSSPQGRQGAAVNAAVPPGGPPGVGPMPGMTGV